MGEGREYNYLVGCRETGTLYAMLQATSWTSVENGGINSHGVISYGMETVRMKWTKHISDL